MTSTIWALVAVAAAVVIGIGTVVAVARARGRAGGEPEHHTVATPCATNGHAYQMFETGWRCAECGNHVARVDGEVYGPAEDGLRERRRERRPEDDAVHERRRRENR
jgi:hypothetical protein